MSGDSKLEKGPGSLTPGNLYAVAHEIINPLTVVAARAEGLAAMVLPGNASLLAGKLARQARYCRTVSRALLGREDDAGGRIGPLRLGPVLEEAVSLADGLRLSGQEIAREWPDDLWARGAPALLECVFYNLIRNALQAGGGECRVTVRARAAGESACVEVIDDGPGLPADVRSEVFERGPAATAPQRGLGMGLWLARHLAGFSGGKLKLARSGPEGCAFKILLPLAEGPPIPSARSATPLAAKEELSGLRVLVVEDDPEVAALLGEGLVMLGHRPELAADSGAALRNLESVPFDAVTIDLKLGAASGLDLYREMLARWEKLARRVVFCSALPLPRAGGPYPGDDPLVLRKPFSMSELAEAVQAAARR